MEEIAKDRKEALNRSAEGVDIGKSKLPEGATGAKIPPAYV
jgi:hypothetical protein